MSDFTPITTQEQLNSVIGDRLRRAEENTRKQYEGYLSPEDVKKQYEGYMSPEDVKEQTEKLQTQLATVQGSLKTANEKSAGYEKDIAEKDAKIKGYEINAMKQRVAHEAGLAYGAVDFIQGEDEESIKASAEKFKALVGGRHSAPGFNNEPPVGNGTKDSIKKLVKGLTPNN